MSPDLIPTPLSVVNSFPSEPAQEDTQSVYIGQAMGIDYMDGLLIVSDQRLTQVHKFTTSGEHVGSIGTIGDGPGELRFITTIRADPIENGFWIVSHRGTRLVHLDLSGKYLGSVILPTAMRPLTVNK